MFEQDHKIVESLLDKDKNFRRLFNKHCQLKSKVREANDGLYSDNERYGNEVEELMQHNNHIEQELIMLKQRVDTSNATVHTDSDGNRSRRSCCSHNRSRNLNH